MKWKFAHELGISDTYLHLDYELLGWLVLPVTKVANMAWQVREQHSKINLISNCLPIFPRLKYVPITCHIKCLVCLLVPTNIFCSLLLEGTFFIFVRKIKRISNLHSFMIFAFPFWYKFFLISQRGRGLCLMCSLWWIHIHVS